MNTIWKVLGFLGLMIVMAAVTVEGLQPPNGPSPLGNLAAWRDWAAHEPIKAFLTVMTAAAAGIGAWGALTQTFGPKPLSDRAGRDLSNQVLSAVGDAETDSAERDARLLAHIRNLEAKIDDLAALNDRVFAADARERVRVVLTGVVEQNRPEQSGIVAAIRSEAPEQVVAALTQAAGRPRADELVAAAEIAAVYDAGEAVDLLIQATEVEPDHSTAWRLLGSALRRLNRLSDAQAAFENAIAHAATPWSKAAAVLDLADLLQRRGDLVRAETALDEAHSQMVHAYGEHPEKPGVATTMARIKLELGQLFRRRNARAEAAAAYRAAMDHFSHLEEGARKTEEVFLSMASCHWHLGGLALDEGNLELAGTYATTNLNMHLSRLDEGRNHPTDKQRVQAAHSMLRRISGEQGDHEQSLHHAMESLSMAQMVVAGQSDQDSFRSELGSSHIEVASSLSALGREEEAEAHNLKAINIFYRLTAQAPDDLYYRMRCVEVEHNLAILASKRGNMATAAEHIGRALRTCRALLAREPENTSYLRRLGSLLSSSGHTKTVMKQFDPAKEDYREAIVVFERLISISPNDAYARSSLNFAASNLRSIEESGA